MISKFCVVCAVLVFECLPTRGAFLVVPEDVGTAFAAIYGFTPRIVIGRDHRFGFGFRFGNHADLQVVYELGPQTTTKALQPSTKTRSVYQQHARRRPFIELLLRAGLLVEARTLMQARPCDRRDLDVDYEPR